MSVRLLFVLALLCVAASPARAQVTLSDEVRFVPPSGQAGFFGGDVSISDDGQVAAIGAFESQNSADRPLGRVLVYVRSGDAWTPMQTLTPPNDATFTSFGHRTALSADGSLLVVSALRAGSEVGAVHLYARLGDAWTLASTIPGPPNSGFRSNFGWSLDLTPGGDYLIVGANAFEPDPDASPRAATGAAFVYSVEPGGAGWMRQARFLPDGSADFDGIGFSVALSNDGTRAFVGAPGAGDNGKVMTYLRTGDAWTEQQTLELFGATFGERNRKFGQAVAISGDGTRLFVAAPDFRGFAGGVYTFDLAFGSWDEGTRILQPTDADEIRFGTALAVNTDGSQAFFGVAASSPLGGSGMFGAGKVFRYAETSSGWTVQQTIEPSDGVEGDLFGSVLTAPPSLDYVLVGAPLKNARDGAAYGYGATLSALSLVVEERIAIVDTETLTLEQVLERLQLVVEERIAVTDSDALTLQQVLERLQLVVEERIAVTDSEALTLQVVLERLRLVVEERIAVTDTEALTLQEILETLRLIVTERIGVQDGLGVAFADGSVALATQFVSGNGVAAFARAGGLAIAFDGVAGFGDVTALFLNTPPADTEGITEADVAGYRWIIEASAGLTFGSGTEVRFDADTLDDIADPAGIVAYKRSTPGSGPFQPLDTRFDEESGQIVASGVDSFSEFVLTSASSTVSVEAPVAIDGDYWLSPLAPNPARTASRLTIRVSQPQHVRADLFDATGRRVRTVADQSMDIGQPYVLRLDASSLSTGLYLLRIQGERFSALRTWSVVR